MQRVSPGLGGLGRPSSNRSAPPVETTISSNRNQIFFGSGFLEKTLSLSLSPFLPFEPMSGHSTGRNERITQGQQQKKPNIMQYSDARMHALDSCMSSSTAAPWLYLSSFLFFFPFSASSFALSQRTSLFPAAHTHTHTHARTHTPRLDFMSRRRTCVPQALV
ncbi:hypothetical protein ABW19_dt0208579 [Dactylella cylindrospora]|nr:hypothetical protein ABW19_dt0208579 [Dactylella cylindrospora]